MYRKVLLIFGKRWEHSGQLLTISMYLQFLLLINFCSFVVLFMKIFQKRKGKRTRKSNTSGSSKSNEFEFLHTLISNRLVEHSCHLSLLFQVMDHLRLIFLIIQGWLWLNIGWHPWKYFAAALCWSFDAKDGMSYFPEYLHFQSLNSVLRVA